MSKKSFHSFCIILPAKLVLCLLFFAPVQAQEIGEDIEVLFGKFRSARKAACGERKEAIQIGKRIIELYKNDELNKEVVEFIKNKVAEMEKEDPKCSRNRLYDYNYKIKNWSDFFLVSKRVIAEEGENPLALDVMLTLVSVGYSRATFDKTDNFNADTLYYAFMAIKRIEAGQISETKKWGVFEPFKTKEAAQSWMNYIIGWLMYNKLGQKRDALAYFYKSTQFGDEKKNDADIYLNIGTFYSNEASRLYMEYLDKRKANNDEDNDETKALLALARGNADRALDVFGRAYYFISRKVDVKTETINVIYQKFVELYRFRFNTETDLTPRESFDEYFKELIRRPMTDPTVPVRPVTENPLEIRLKNLKLQ